MRIKSLPNPHSTGQLHSSSLPTGGSKCAISGVSNSWLHNKQTRTGAHTTRSHPAISSVMHAPTHTILDTHVLILSGPRQWLKGCSHTALVNTTTQGGNLSGTAWCRLLLHCTQYRTTHRHTHLSAVLPPIHCTPWLRTAPDRVLHHRHQPVGGEGEGGGGEEEGRGAMEVNGQELTKQVSCQAKVPGSHSLCETLHKPWSPPPPLD